MLAVHADFARRRAPEVGYSAQVLFQELKRRGFAGGYDTMRKVGAPERLLRSDVNRFLIDTASME